MSSLNATFLVHKKELGNAKLVNTPIPEIGEQEILFQIDKYVLSSNNITYAVTGYQFKYWEFFPTEEPFGIIPVWGVARVIESKHPDIKVGERFFGYFPMSRVLKAEIGNITPHGFMEKSAHRKGLMAIYNYYTNLGANTPADTTVEDYSLVSRITFSTSFLLYHLLKDESFFGADQIILTSASSKTALGLAYLLRQNQPTDGKKLIGLTSPRNLDFVKAVGYYDEVVAYADLENKIPAHSSTVLDFSGNSELLIRMNDLLKEKLQHTTLIGITDWRAEKAFAKLPNTAGFHAGIQSQKKKKEWGLEKMTQLIGKELAGFIKSTSAWMSLHYIKDADALAQFYQELLKGQISPHKGYIVQH